MNENKLKIKDLVNIGIFSTIYMVVSLLTMILAMFSPICLYVFGYKST